MKDEILKAAEHAGFGGQLRNTHRVRIERLYKTAFNAGIEAAAKLVDEKFDELEPWLEPHEVRALVMK